MVEVCNTEDEFNAVKGKAASENKTLFVDFTATWCGPCRMIGPKFEAFAEQYKDAYFVKVDVDENEAVAAKYGISAMPTFIAIKNGEKVDELVGASEEKLKGLIEKNIQ